MPGYVKRFLSYLSRQVSLSRHHSCAMEMHAWATRPRVDPEASEGRAGVGGSASELDEQGRPDTWRTKWYNREITWQEWPLDIPAQRATSNGHLDHRGGRSSDGVEEVLRKRSLKKPHSDADDPVLRRPSWLTTNMYQSRPNVMELACYLKRMWIEGIVEWAPRTANQEADELAKAVTTRFDPPMRAVSKESKLDWDILAEALQKEREMEREGQQARAEGGRLPDRARPRKRRKLEDKMRVRDPW